MPMEETIRITAPRRRRVTQNPPEKFCVLDVRAEFLTVGGLIFFAVCGALTTLVAMVWNRPDVTGIQRGIVAVLAAGAWAYFFTSATERLRLVDHSIEYSGLLSHTQRIPLDDLESILLVHQGLNAERGIETIEFRRTGANRTERIALGPCWQRHHLEAFFHSIEEELRSPEMLEEVR